MAEFTGIPPVGLNSIVRPAPEAPPPAVPKPEAGLKGGGLSGQMSSNPRNPFTSRFSERQGQAWIDPGQHAGPSPAFQASVLELELDLQNTIARVEAARGKRESDIASGLAPVRNDADGSTKSGDDNTAISPDDAGRQSDQIASTTAGDSQTTEDTSMPDVPYTNPSEI